MRVSKGGGQAIVSELQAQRRVLAKSPECQFSGALLLPSGIGFRAVGSPQGARRLIFGS